MPSSLSALSLTTFVPLLTTRGGALALFFSERAGPAPVFWTEVVLFAEFALPSSRLSPVAAKVA